MRIRDLLRSRREPTSAAIAAAQSALISSLMRCRVCGVTAPDHAPHCFMRPDALTAPRGGIDYLRSRGFVAVPPLGAPTPLYDELARERDLDPELVRRRAEVGREFLRSWARPSSVLLPPGSELTYYPEREPYRGRHRQQ